MNEEILSILIKALCHIDNALAIIIIEGAAIVIALFLIAIEFKKMNKKDK